MMCTKKLELSQIIAMIYKSNVDVGRNFPKHATLQHKIHPRPVGFVHPGALLNMVYVLWMTPSELCSLSGEAVRSCSWQRWQSKELDTPYGQDKDATQTVRSQLCVRLLLIRVSLTSQTLYHLATVAVISFGNDSSQNFHRKAMSYPSCLSAQRDP